VLSGCTLILDAYNLNIPDEVMDHPVLRSLGEATNDLVTWSNVSEVSQLGIHLIEFHLSI